MLFCLWDYGTMPHAKSLFHWSVIHYQVTFEGHSEFGWEKSIGLRIYQNLNFLKFAYLKPCYEFSCSEIFHSVPLGRSCRV